MEEEKILRENRLDEKAPQREIVEKERTPKDQTARDFSYDDYRHTDYRRSKKEIEYEENRSRRAFSYVWGIVWSIILIIFFNFFSKYIAYFQFEKVNGELVWNIYPITTQPFNTIVPLITAALIVLTAGNIILLIVDRYVLARVIEIITAIFASAVLVNFILLFPLDFNIIPYDKISEFAPLALKIILGIVVLVLIIQIITNFVKIIARMSKK